MRINRALSFMLLLTFGVGVQGDGKRMNHVIRSISGEDALLHCLAPSEPGVQYQSITWYKVSEAPSRQLTGLLIKKLTHHNSTVQRYKGVERDLELMVDSKSLVLPNVTVQDTGKYSCLLSAPVGRRNQEGEIHLEVFEDYSNEDGILQEDDTIFVIVAITLLVVALLMLYISYTCLKNTLSNPKSKFSKETSKKIHKMKETIINLESKGIVCTLVSPEYV